MELQPFFGFVFVLGQLDCDRTRVAGHRCLHVLKVLSVSELNAIAGAVASTGNVTLLSRVHDRARRRADFSFGYQPLRFFKHRLKINYLIEKQRLDKLHGLLQQVRSCLLGAKLDGHIVETAALVTRLAVRSANTRKLRQFKRDVFYNVAKVSSFFESSDETARSSQAAVMMIQSRKSLKESFVEALKLTALAFCKHAQVQMHE